MTSKKQEIKKYQLDFINTKNFSTSKNKISSVQGNLLFSIGTLSYAEVGARNLYFQSTLVYRTLVSIPLSERSRVS